MKARYTIALFFIGIVWGWGILALIGVTLEISNRTAPHYINMGVQNEMPEIINTIDTIPVEVYKLERT